MTESTTTAADATATPDSATVSGHGGIHAVAAATAHGVQTMFTLSGAHVFPLYDAAVGGKEGNGPLRLVDVRHESTAVFAAEGTAKLTRTPGLAVVTAGPGVTNAISGMASAQFNGAPVVVVGGRAPAFRWGTGALQEFDHIPLVTPVTKYAATISDPAEIHSEFDAAFTLANTPHRGPVFLDIPMDVLFSPADVPCAVVTPRIAAKASSGDLEQIAQLLANAERPVIVLGSDVWNDDAIGAARRLVATLALATIPNGMGRGILRSDDSLLVTGARGAAFGGADVVVVVGAPLDFRLGYGAFGGKDGSTPAAVVHIVDAPDQLAGHVTLAGSAAGDLSATLDGIREVWEALPHVDHAVWNANLAALAAESRAKTATEMASDADPIHPARIYGELIPRLADDAVVIGDGGDFVSFAGRYIEPNQPGCWMDPGPFGCLGTGLGYAMAARIARPDSQVVLLMGDGAAGFSLMDVDSLVRHNLPVVMVVGNNGTWGLEKHPMQFLYGYDVAAELQQGLQYDAVVRGLGGAGETVTKPGDIGAALDRAFASGVPYMVNVITDPAVAYPRTTTGV
jgi:acetolactate synthase-1/2/3 large subunit